VIVRDAEPRDVPAMTAIYARHVRHGFGTFEEVPPEPAEIASRMEAVRASGLPWLAAEIDGRVAGYGYCSPYRPRSGYRFTAEDSVYVDPELTGRGVGRALLEALVARCEALGLRQLLASIGDSGNVASIALHRSCGFEIAGVLSSVGFKHGRWVDVVFMRRPLNGGDETLPELHPGGGGRIMPS